MKNLYDLTQDMLDFEVLMNQATDEETGAVDMPDETIARYFKLEEATADKIDSYIHLMENLTAEAAIRKAEYETFRDLIAKHHKAAKSAEARIARLKEYMKSCMEMAGRLEIKTDHFTVKVVKNGGNPAVIVPDNPDFKTWPDDLYAIKTEPDKDAIRKAAAENRELPEGVEVYRGTNLRIK